MERYCLAGCLILGFYLDFAVWMETQIFRCLNLHWQKSMAALWRGNAFSHHWPFVKGIQSLGDSLHKMPLMRSFDVYLILAGANCLPKSPDVWNLGQTCDNSKFQHEEVIISIIKCGVKSLIHSQTSTVALLKFKFEYIISPHTW